MPNNPLRKAPPHYNKCRVKRLALQGMSQNSIAKDQGVEPSTICRYLNGIGLTQQYLAQYKKQRPDIKALIGCKAEDKVLIILESLTEEVIKTMSPAAKNGLLMALNAIIGTRHQEERLERGLSTDNHSSISLVESLDAKRKELKEMLAMVTKTDA